MQITNKLEGKLTPPILKFLFHFLLNSLFTFSGFYWQLVPRVVLLLVHNQHKCATLELFCWKVITRRGGQKKKHVYLNYMKNKQNHAFILIKPGSHNKILILNEYHDYTMKKYCQDGYYYLIFDVH